MGKLIKNHWARLIILVAAAYQVVAAIQAYFWPKLFFDFLTTNLDPAVRPVPILQTINLFLGLLGVCWEWPLPIFISCSTASRLGKHSHPHKVSHQHKLSHHFAPSELKGRSPSPPFSSTQPAWRSALAFFHRSIETRLLIYPLSSLASLLLYQGTNAGLYYIIGMGVYFWAFSEGEVVMGVPWTLPRRRRNVVAKV